MTLTIYENNIPKKSVKSTQEIVEWLTKNGNKRFIYNVLRDHNASVHSNWGTGLKNTGEIKWLRVAEVKDSADGRKNETNLN